MLERARSHQPDPEKLLHSRRILEKGTPPKDLFALIPRASPIAQAELFEAARAAGINQKYTREFLSSLIADKRIAVQKIRREKAKSAIGYIRSPAHPKSTGAAEDMRGGS